MNIWENAVITAQGLALQAKLLEGSTLKLTRAATGTGYVTPGLLQQQTAVSNEAQSLEFSSMVYPEPDKCAVTMRLTNSGLEKGYTALQVGVYVEDQNGNEILYFIAQANSEAGTIIPSESEMPGYSAEWTFYFQFGQADGVEVTVNPANTVSWEEMERYFSEELVPMTAEEIDAIFNS